MSLLTIRQQVYLTLRQRILDGTYSPGTHLNIDALSKELGVSNSPLREAMLLLINDRLAESRPNSGVFVINITPKLYSDLTDTINSWIVGAYYLCVRCERQEVLITTLEQKYKDLNNIISSGSDQDKVFTVLAYIHGFVEATDNEILISSFESDFDRFCLAYTHNHMGRDFDWTHISEQAALVISMIKEGDIDSFSKIIWEWSTPHFF